MKKKIWDLYAPIYERAMRADRKVYAFMYERIPTVIHGKEVLEIATGPEWQAGSGRGSCVWQA